MDIGLISQLLNIILASVVIYAGVKYTLVSKILKELGEALSYTIKALEDNKLTKEELIGIIREWKDLFNF